MAFFRQGVPAGWQWRDGRPRWIPSPTLRKAGWKGKDLKAGPRAADGWLKRGASIDAAQAIVNAVEAWRAGQLIPAELGAIAPAGAVSTPGAGLPSTLADRRAIGRLIDDYKASKAFLGNAPRTQADYANKLSRFIDVMAGYVDQPQRPDLEGLPPDEAARRMAAYKASWTRYQNKRATVRSLSVDVLEPPPFDQVETADEAHGLLFEVYWRFHDEVGVHMAGGVMAAVSAWLSWCVKIRAVQQNWAMLVDRKTPPGRIRVGTWDELTALIRAAEARGYHSIADSIILGVDLSWSQVDRLSLTWAQITADGKVKGARQKTGRKGETPLLAGLGRARLPAIRKRQAERFGENVQPTHVLICEDTGKPWKPDWYRHCFAEVRALAAAECPSVADLRDQDLRDTAITVGKTAGLKDEELASRSLHSLRRIKDVLDKHYVEIGQEIADAGADKLNAYLGARGITL